MPLTALTGADVVLPDAVLPGGTVVLDGNLIATIEPAGGRLPDQAQRVDCSDDLLLPGFVDVHVHGVEGVDVLDGPTAVSRVARALPKYGVTAFCPTSVACSPADLEVLLGAVRDARMMSEGAQILGAHLESNFINPDYKGAQPIECLRHPRESLIDRSTHAPSVDRPADFTAADVLKAIEAHSDAVAIITLAPELEGGLDLVRHLVSRGHRVSIGHSGATHEIACAAIDAGVRHATHLFNRMSPLGHRAAGVPGAVLTRDEVAAELICDGFHLHPAVVRLAIAAKGVDRIMAITDGTAGSGLPVGTRTHLGRCPIIVTARTAELEDGTLAGSVLTMDGGFRMLVQHVGLTAVQAARVCATTPAKELGLADGGIIRAGGRADLVVLDRNLRVRRTYVAGRAVFEAG
jgi:N-acetylglucosamine-6-phosphate deacetylase